MNKSWDTSHCGDQHYRKGHQVPEAREAGLGKRAYLGIWGQREGQESLGGTRFAEAALESPGLAQTGITLAWGSRLGAPQVTIGSGYGMKAVFPHWYHWGRLDSCENPLCVAWTTATQGTSAVDLQG